MGVDKGKKQKLEEVEEGNDSQLHIDGELVLSIEKLQEIQVELEKINEEASDKVLEVEQKYTAMRKPVYDKRNEHIKSIPVFWLTAFMSHPALGELLTENDQKIFKYLCNLEVEESKDVKSGYSITFNFDPNPYFENSVLMKTLTFLEEGTTTITATSIKWKEDLGIHNGVVEEKKGTKRSYAEESFFTWFSETQHKGDMVEIHDEVAEIIKDDLCGQIPSRFLTMMPMKKNSMWMRMTKMMMRKRPVLIQRMKMVAKMKIEKRKQAAAELLRYIEEL